MPNVTVYFDDHTYSRIERLMNLWDMTRGRVIKYLVQRGLEVVEKEVDRWQRRGVTVRCTRRT